MKLWSGYIRWYARYWAYACMFIIGHTLDKVKSMGWINLISYAPLWKTMKIKGATTYTLRNKGGEENISGSTILRLQKNESVSTNTLDSLCRILNCQLSDVAEYVPDWITFNTDRFKHISKGRRFVHYKPPAFLLTRFFVKYLTCRYDFGSMIRIFYDKTSQ